MDKKSTVIKGNITHRHIAQVCVLLRKVTVYGFIIFFFFSVLLTARRR